MVFFLVFFFQFIVTLIQALGPNDGGHCGFIMALSQFDGTTGGIFAGIFLLFIASGFALAAAANIIMLGKVSYALSCLDNQKLILKSLV